MAEMNGHHSLENKEAAFTDDNARSSTEVGLGEETIDPARETKLLAKLDLFFVPIIMVVYLSCFLDRANIGKGARDITLLPRSRANQCRKCENCWNA